MVAPRDKSRSTFSENPCVFFKLESRHFQLGCLFFCAVTTQPNLWKFANSDCIWALARSGWWGVKVSMASQRKNFPDPRKVGTDAYLWWICLATGWYNFPSRKLFFFFQLQGQFIIIKNKWNMVLIKTACWLNNLYNFKNILNAEEEHADVRNGLRPHYNSNRINKEKNCEVIKTKLS